MSGAEARPRWARGLYAITSEALCRAPAQLPVAVAAALAGGAVMIQYRDKWQDAPAREASARTLLALCRAHGVPLIVNDDPQLAARIGADGVHLGRADAPLASARSALGAGAIVGVTCNNVLARAQAAAAGGASYVAFGRFFESRTKPDAPGAELSLLREARAQLTLPLCAIGGITPARAGEVMAAGADLVAAVDGVFGSLDPAAIEAAARAYARCF